MFLAIYGREAQRTHYKVLYPVGKSVRDYFSNNVLDTVRWVYFHMKDFDKAISYLEQASRKLPDFALFRYHLGLIYCKAGRLSEAKSELEIALSKGGNAPWAAEVKDLLATISSR